MTLDGTTLYDGDVARITAHPNSSTSIESLAATVVDELDYGLGSQILTDLGVRSMILLTASPNRRYHLAPFGLSITGTRTLDA